MTTATTTMSVEERKEIAETIYIQLGGNRVKAMIGVEQLVHSENAEGNAVLTIKFKAKSKKVNGKSPNILKVEYVYATDTYTMSFHRVHGVNVSLLSTVENAYADQMKEIFESTTGLYLSL